MNLHRQAISVVGLGKLGLGMAACFSSRGFDTLGVDLNEAVVAAVESGSSPIQEPGVEELLQPRRLRATRSHAEAIAHADVTIVMVPTPSDGDGRFSNRLVEAALTSLGQALAANGKPNHTFILSSTVMPTSLTESLVPLLERACGRRLDQGVELCYCPDFVALGSVIHDYLRPDFILIGECSPEAGRRVEAIYRKLIVNEAPIYRMSLVSAEIAKVSLNFYITLKISFANTLANLCAMVPGADVDAITTALGTDRRISPYYLRGGLGYGGTCFPRDTHAFKAFARKLGYPPLLTEATDRVNDLQDELLLALVQEHMPSDRGVSLLGLSFKPGTPVIEASPAIRLAERLVALGAKVAAYDPQAMPNARGVLGDGVRWCASLQECVQASRLSVLLTAWPEFRRLEASDFGGRNATVIDCWRVLDSSRLHGVRYLALGRAEETAVTAG